MAEEEEFLDFSIASALEGLAARIASCIQLLMPKEKSSYMVIEHALPFRKDSYILSKICGPEPCPFFADAVPSKLQDWFHIGQHLTLVPDSYSGRILDAEEAVTLLSAASLALRQTQCALPLFVPVADALRDGARGVHAVQGADSALGDQGNPAAVIYESDSVHTSQLPHAMFYPGHQLGMLARRCEAAGDPRAAAACRTAAAGLPIGEHESYCGDGERTHLSVTVGLTSRASFAVPPVQQASSRLSDPSTSDLLQCLFGSPSTVPLWLTPLAKPSHVQLDLDLVWHYDDAHRAVLATDTKFDPGTATYWRLVALDTDSVRDDGHRGFALRAVDQRRWLLRIPGVAGFESNGPRSMHGSYSNLVPSSTEGSSTPHGASNTTPLAQCLGRVAAEHRWVSQAASMADLANRDWWLRRGIQTDGALEYVDRYAEQLVDCWSIGYCRPPDASSNGKSKGGNQSLLQMKSEVSMPSLARFVLGLASLREIQARAQVWMSFLEHLRTTVTHKLRGDGAKHGEFHGTNGFKPRPDDELSDNQSRLVNSCSHNCSVQPEEDAEKGKSIKKTASESPAPGSILGAMLGVLCLCLLRAEMAVFGKLHGMEASLDGFKQGRGTKAAASLALTPSDWIDLWHRSTPGATEYEEFIGQREEEAEHALNVLHSLTPTALWAELESLGRWAALCALRARPGADTLTVTTQLDRLCKHVEAGRSSSDLALPLARAESLVGVADSLLRTLESGNRDQDKKISVQLADEILSGAVIADGETAGSCAVGVTLHSPKAKLLAARLLGSTDSCTALDWPTAHRTEWRIDALREEKTVHSLHVEALAAELRVSCTLSLLGARVPDAPESPS